MQYTTHFTGKGFIEELESRDKMSADQAVSWIESKTGYKYDPDAMYKLRWSSGDEARTWSGYPALKVHIMHDSELAKLDAEYRKLNKLPPRKPWEPWIHESSLGRAGAASRLDAGT